MLHTRFRFPVRDVSRNSRCSLHLPHTTDPHLRQWWRLLRRVNLPEQHVHVVASSSGTHTPASLVFLLMRMEKRSIVAE